MIWIVFALMVAAVLAVILVPLLRGRGPQATRAEYDLAVYRDQLAEVDRDVERGVLTADQAEAARVEIQRRMLSIAPGAKAAGGKALRPAAVAAAVAVAVPLVSFGIYYKLGNPALPDQPYAARAAQIAQDKAQANQFQEMVDTLAARLQQQPGDGKGWAMLGRSLAVLGQTDRAQDAYEKALPLLPGDAQVRLEYATLLLADVPEDGPVPPRVAAIMREVLAIDPDNPRALFFVGLDEAQRGHTTQARAMLEKVQAMLPPDSAERAEVGSQLDRLK